MTRSEVLKMNNNKLNDVVKIQGTNYDRKRKVTKQMAYRMTQMLNAGKSVSVVAEHFGVTPRTVKYNTDENYRRYYLDHNPGGHSRTLTSAKDRAEYKRELLKNRRPIILDI